MAARPLSVQDLALGRPLLWPIHDRHGNLLLRKGDVIRTEGLLNAMLERGFVQESEPAQSRRSAPLAPRVDYQRLPVFSRLRAAQELHEAVLVKFHSELSDALVDCAKLAGLIGQACEQDADAALAAFQFDAFEQVRNGSARSLHCAVLVDQMCRATGMSDERRLLMISVGMTYDLGMFRLADTFNSQRGELNAEQRDLLHQHPQASCDLLRRAGVESDVWLSAVLDHHERADGSGYPRALKAEEISREARLIALVDVFSAMIRPRAYRDAIQAKDALRQIFLERGKQVDLDLAQVFIREIGMYPPGSMVKLQNGEIAVVAQRGADAAHPLVRSLLSASGQALTDKVERRTDNGSLAIIGLVNPTKYRGLLPNVPQIWTRSPLPELVTAP